MTHGPPSEARPGSPANTKTIRRSELKILLNRVDNAFRKTYYQQGGWPARALYTICNTSHRGERRAVYAGIAEYYRTAGLQGQRYMLRRNVHMLEKGLCMQPRRDTFAVDYIGDTIAHLDQLADNSRLDAAESRWCFDVLTTYFEATSESTNIRIRQARTRFDLTVKRLQNECPAERASSAPFQVNSEGAEAAVTIAQLTVLASSRSSVRWFQPRAVERVEIDHAVTVAVESPTACNRVPWRLHIIDDQRRASDVAKVAMGTRGYSQQIPNLAVMIGDLSAYFNERDRHLIYIDGSLSAMSFILALQTLGVSSCCINWPDIPSRQKDMARKLGLKPHERVVMLIAFGYADPNSKVPFSEKPSLERVRTFDPA